jgi:two-component sensor histidine kinase
VPSLTDVVHQHTDLGEADLAWLHLLVTDWQLLADLSFADLVLWVPDRDGTGFRAAGQIRPTTGPTAYVEDLVGAPLRRGRRPMVDAAFDSGHIRRDGDPEWWDDVPVRVEAIPVRHSGRVLGVIARTSNLAGFRTPSRLELVYLECAGLLARMVAAGTFPQAGPDVSRGGAPRVGDGMIRLDPPGVATYASPNAVSAYRRLGLTADLVGQHLGRLTAQLAPPEGPVEEALAAAVSGREPRLLEIEARGVVLALRTIPLAAPVVSGAPVGTAAGPSADTAHAGAVVLCRDVSEIRRRERELLSKDATIREIHHRVKNNLQTVAALLRIQARRVTGDAARAALAEAERRVGTIAVVHEILAGAADDAVPFDEVAARLLAVVADMSTADATLRTARTGSFGVLDAAVAAPLAMVLNELLQNAAEHGMAGDAGEVCVDARRDDAQLVVLVEDRGDGIPEDFAAQSGPRIGLQIVRALVHGELAGEISFQRRPGGGTQVRLVVPLADRPHR